MAELTRLDAQLAFLIEACHLKTIDRANVLMDGSRRENSAEHSWHLALWALVFGSDAPANVDVDRAIVMLLVHDLVEIDAGDHPIHLEHDQAKVAAAEQRAATRLFGILPQDQGNDLKALWVEFENGVTATANYARRLDMSQPLFQELANPAQSQTDHDILRSILETGRSAALADEWPDLYGYAISLLNKVGTQATSPLRERLAFLAEADQLKTTLRATQICAGTRRENSGEHSWHIALYALVLAEHANRAVQISRVVRMLLIHDLVEIDAGDAPIHGDHDIAEQDRIERLAADRIYGLLPDRQAADLRTLWDEFEAAETNDAVFAKSIDRVQPVISNLETGGGTWPEYNVTATQLETRVGWKVAKGAPAVWAALSSRIDAWFSENMSNS